MGRRRMSTVLGVDAHKRTHTVCGSQHCWAEARRKDRARHNFGSRRGDHVGLGIGSAPISQWGVEDCRPLTSRCWNVSYWPPVKASCVFLPT